MEEKARGGTLLYRRLARGEVPERYLALALDRAPEALPEKPHWLYDGRVTVRVPLRLEAGERATLRFAFGVGAHEQDAFQAAQQTLAMPRSAFSDLSARFAAQCGMDAPELAAAMALTGPLSAGRFTPHAESALRSRDALWRCGVSGDRPILAAPLTRAEHRSAAELLVRRHALLSRCGLESDLVFCIEPDGDYYQTGRQTVTQALRALDLEAALHAPGGVFFSEDTETIRANAAVWADPAADDTPPRSTLPVVMSTKDRRDLACETPPVQYAADGSIAFTMERALPRRAWAQVLTNGRLGFFAADSGCGAMWYQNAHLGRITPWRNDPWAVSGPERLERLGSARQSLFADSENTVRAVYGFGAAAWQSDDVRVTAFIPWEDDVRVLLLTDCPALYAQTEQLNAWLSDKCIDYNGDKKVIAETVYIPVSKESMENSGNYSAAYNSQLLVQFQTSTCMLVLVDPEAEKYLQPEDMFLDMTKIYPDCPYAEGRRLLIDGTNFAELIGMTEPLHKGTYLTLRIPAENMNTQEENQEAYDRAKALLDSILEELKPIS